MGNTTDGSARGRKHSPAPDVTPLLPVCDTVSGRKATADPDGTIRHYERLADHLWLPDQLRETADRLFEHVRTGSTRWASISGPYGYGKTAAGVSVWQHARQAKFTAIPPLSCSNYDELAHAVAAMAGAQYPQGQAIIDRVLRKVWGQGLDAAVQADSARYELPGRTVRRLLQDKLRAGQLSLDGQCHRLVEFLSELGHVVTKWSSGLILVLDELQQLLGPLDTRSITQFREFVWGMRTERSPCGVVVCLDAMLEARLARWAADLLHRIRESGPALQMAEVYTREFPRWLWGQLTTANGSPARLDAKSATRNVLVSLGQFVERPDLANGPRTVVDVFCRASAHHAATRKAYDVGDLVADIEAGRFRYFGEGATVQRTLAELLRDDWLQADPYRVALVRALAAFPRGCPDEVATAAAGSGRRLAALRKELFGPLLVELPEGLALERLQQVRRPVTDWERVLSRCWETLPSQDALLSHAPDMVWRVLVGRVFPSAQGPSAHWERTSDDNTTALTGWCHLRGSFDEDFPQREVAVWVGTELPGEWPDDVDLSFAFRCSPDPAATADASLVCDQHSARVAITLPVLRPIDGFVPPELERHRKYLQPEPFRGLTVIAAVHELKAVAGPEESDAPPALRSFLDMTTSFVAGELIQGAVHISPKLTLRQRGVELVRALFSAACRVRFPRYRTLATAHNWRELVDTYRKGLRTPDLDDVQRKGESAVTGMKGEVVKRLFDQRSIAAGDSMLRVLGPLVEAGGTADVFSVRLTTHPGEKLALEYLQKTARKRGVPRSAVHEVLRHTGFLSAEADALIDLLCDRGLLASGTSGLRVMSQDPSSQADAEKDIKTFSARLRAMAVNDIPPRPKKDTVRDLWSYADSLRVLLNGAVEVAVRPVQDHARRLREMIGAVRAEELPTEWAESGVARHLQGISKLLGRNRTDLQRALYREADRADQEIAKAADTGEKWAVEWRKRGAAFDRIWGEVGQRVDEFIRQAKDLQVWVPLNERLAAITEMAERVVGTDRALSTTVRALVSELRTQFATSHWEPLRTHEAVTRRVSEVERQAQGLAFSGVCAYLREVETLRSRFGDLLRGSPPAIGSDHTNALPFDQLYEWAELSFREAAVALKTRRDRQEPWRPSTRKSHSWAEVSGQLDRAWKGLRPRRSFEATIRLGELIKLLRDGFVRAAAANRTAVFEAPEQAGDVALLADLLAHGQIRIRVDWLDTDGHPS